MKRKLFILVLLTSLRHILTTKQKTSLSIIEINFQKLQLKKLAPQLLTETKKMKIWFD